MGSGCRTPLADLCISEADGTGCTLVALTIVAEKGMSVHFLRQAFNRKTESIVHESSIRYSVSLQRPSSSRAGECVMVTSCRILTRCSDRWAGAALVCRQKNRHCSNGSATPDARK